MTTFFEDASEYTFREPDPVRSRLGRPSLIEDPNLHNRRDQLVQNLEAYWGEIGWKIQRCKTPDELIPILCALSLGTDDAILAFNMLYGTPPSSSASLRKARRESRELIRPRRAAQQLQRDSEERLSHAQMASALATASQLPLVLEELGLRQLEAQQRREQYREIDERDNALLAEIKLGGGSFARGELLRFLKSKRYELNPLNLANAMAGLPYMGWRQSMRRCSKERCISANGLNYQIFKSIRYLLSNARKKTEPALIEHFRKSIPLLPRRHKLPKKEFAEKWFFLERAIREVCRLKIHPKSLPFEITKHYFKQTRMQSAPDILLAERAKLNLS